ncbi:hypothetical protein, partial [Pseudonocardia eucalypti]|uniref:hypothetical protein n=1 Tax=Pseudonocardia eucalypti TaxID=648755 RepID=UPI0031E9504A
MIAYDWIHAPAATKARATELGLALRAAAENDPRFVVQAGADVFDLTHPAVPASKITGFARLVAALPEGVRPIIVYGGDSGSDFNAIKDALQIAAGELPASLAHLRELFDAVVDRWATENDIISVAVAGPHTSAAFTDA